MERSTGISADGQVAFSRDGFLVIPDFLSAGRCDSLRAQANRLVESFDPKIVSVFSTKEQTRTSDDYFLGSGSAIRFFFEEEAFLPDGSLRQKKELSINKIGHALHTLDPVFSELSRDPAMLSIIRDLGMKAPRQIQSMYIFKNPFIGGDVSCHQDATFLFTDPLSVVGLWIALEDATTENGCLWALPGGHKGPLRKRFVRAQGGGTAFVELSSEPFPEVSLNPPWRAIPVAKGTLVLLHGLLPHWSGPNRSPKSRHAYTIHVIDESCHYPAENWLRPAQ